MPHRAGSVYTYSVKQMRSKHILPFLALAVSLLTVAQLLQAQQLKLSQSFSVAALGALKAINSTGWALPSSVRELEMRQAEAQSKMEDAKDAAESQDDADAFVYLQRYQLRHSQNFGDYTNAITQTAAKMTGKDALHRAAALVAKDPKFIARKNKEQACAAALEKKLQSRVFSPPSACDLY
jgi:transposase-like protein